MNQPTDITVLATSVVTPSPLDEHDEELKLVRVLWENSLADIDRIHKKFNLTGERASLFAAWMPDLIKRGIAIKHYMGGRDVYDLTENFRNLVREIQAKIEAEK